jgi:hypothetical protein
MFLVSSGVNSGKISVAKLVGVSLVGDVSLVGVSIEHLPEVKMKFFAI